MMKILTQKRCTIGEGPIWCEREGLLYFVNGMENEICTYNPDTETICAYPQELGVAAIAFARDGRMLVTRRDGAFFLDLKQGTTSPMYDETIKISNANDAKVGPDGCFYVGTQSEFRLGLSEKIDGKLYRITPDGEVTVLLDRLILANGMDWSPDERFFYLADTGAKKVRKYAFDKGKIQFTGQEVHVSGADGLTVDQSGTIFVASWGKNCIVSIDPETMQIKDTIPVPTKAPASCAFFGKEMNQLAITTANFGIDTEEDKNAGFLFIQSMNTQGRLPYLLGEKTQ
ncbi:MAG: SMP-30/gluconolactonase/LRE family protein [Clostridia bacterium]|nr:SMP-30/gluconolactonase/LRE family protein [Clostridia bacterium]